MNENAELGLGTDAEAGVDVKSIMADVEAEVRRKRDEGLYPPDVLVELDAQSAYDADDGADGERVGSALADLQRSSHFTALVTTASRKPFVAPVIAQARRAMRSSLSWYMNGILEQVSRFADNTVRAAGLLAERTSHLEGRLNGVDDRLARLDEWTARVEDQRVPERLARLDRAVRDLRDRIEASPPVARTSNGDGGSAASPSTAASWAAERSFDYLEFENRFRGTPEQIADRQRFYVDLFRGAEARVVDIGCGRGEFLGLLAEAGVPCYGLDRHPDMVALCREKGLDVVEGDSLAHLAATEPGSLGGMFCCQMVEHLDPAEVPGFFELSLRALAPGAPLVVETINPESLFVFAHAFYVDLGHLRPLHPLTLEFLAQVAGFSSVKVEYLSPVPPDFRPQKLPAVDAEPLAGVVSRLDENFRRIDDILFGPQDFAVVAYR